MPADGEPTDSPGPAHSRGPTVTGRNDRGVASERTREHTTDRGQLSLPAAEAAIGIAVLLAVTATFGLAVPEPPTTEARLDAYAADTATVLADASPQHGDRARLAEIARSEAAFTRERATLRRRVARTLSENLLFRVETPHGAVGYALPEDAPLGRARVPTRHGPVVIWVWYV